MGDKNKNGLGSTKKTKESSSKTAGQRHQFQRFNYLKKTSPKLVTVKDIEEFNKVSVEHRAIIKFFTKKKLNAKDIYAEMVAVYNEDTPNVPVIKHWLTQYKNGREKLFNDTATIAEQKKEAVKRIRAAARARAKEKAQAKAEAEGTSEVVLKTKKAATKSPTASHLNNNNNNHNNNHSAKLKLIKRPHEKKFQINLFTNIKRLKDKIK